jgi:hypothetical protein
LTVIGRLTLDAGRRLGAPGWEQVAAGHLARFPNDFDALSLCLPQLATILGSDAAALAFVEEALGRLPAWEVALRARLGSQAARLGRRLDRPGPKGV